ncbi:MAG: TonB family protein [Rhodanobacter sp.]
MSSLVLDGVQIIGRVLLHFLWQAALVGAIYAAVRSVLPRGEWRYRFGMGALVVLGGLPLLTGAWLLETSAIIGQGAFNSTRVPLAAFTVAAADSGWSWGAGLDAILPWLVLAWFAGVLLLSVRAWQQWRRLKILVDLAERTPQWQARLNRMAKRFGLRRRIGVLRSSLVLTPVLVGWLRPVILLPLAVACDFPVSQVELILAHELAHLKRWDPLANLFQVLLETLHFYHPAVHWISRDVRNEREICCDRLALSITGGSRQEFAATLAQLGELREHPGSLGLAANGGVLLDRVQYMVLPPARGARKRSPARLLAVVVGTALIATTLRLEWHQARQREALAGVSSVVPSLLVPLAIAMKNPWALAPNLTPAALLPHAAPFTVVNAEAENANARLIEASLPRVPIATIPVITPAMRPIALSDAIADMPRVASVSSAATEAAVVSAAGLTPVRVQQPVYPQMALTRGLQGQVVLEFGLAGDGSLRDVRVVRAEPAGVFDQAAIHAMHGWKYPAPSAAGMQRRYQQTMMFVLDAPLARHHAESGTGAREEMQARADCQIPTGTHICRRPNNGAGFVKDSL